MFKRKPKVLTPEQAEELRTKDFFDMILPGTVKFLSDHYILGDSYRCVWVIREYPPSTEEQAILAQLADRSGVTLRIYHRLVEAGEQRKIIQNATRRNKLKSGGNDVNETIEAEGNLQDVVELLANLRKNREPLLHVSVFLELKARSMEALRELQSDIAMELTRSKISVDRLTLRQKEGFLSVLPVGANQFGAQYERVLPASSVANLYPFNFSGKTDPQGLYIGRDKFGTNILVDFDRRAEDKTTSNILILGNSGQEKAICSSCCSQTFGSPARRSFVWIRNRNMRNSVHPSAAAISTFYPASTPSIPWSRKRGRMAAARWTGQRRRHSERLPG